MPTPHGPRAGGELVSVIVPTYNYARFIGEMIESLLRQTYARWECVIVDDGSADDTQEVVARFAASDRRIRYFRQENRGQPGALNTGLRLAAGDYVQFLDADDLLGPRKLEAHVECLRRRPDVDIVYGATRFFVTREGEAPPEAWDGARLRLPEGTFAGRDVLPHLLRANIMTVNSSLMRRRVVEAVGLFDESLSPIQDWDYWLRAALAGMSFRFEEEEGALALVRAHAASASRNRAVMYRAAVLMREKFAGLTRDAELLRLNREMLTLDTGRLGIEEAAGGDVLKGVRRLVRAARLGGPPSWRAKWLFCALAAPLVPEARLREIAAAPISRAAAGLRRRTRTG
ncbi:MAG TPA: glycosyltransferase [Pyrinomonadaceae bacterium]|nr:glycosyltransferase [Pyrinomonadaceae bacterium]